MSSLEDDTVIEPNTKRGKHDKEDEDRLSDLPDCVILHILSFLNAKNAVQTCILSTRWKHLWKRIPALILHADMFSTSNIFVKFVSGILRLRDGSIALQTFDFDSHTFSGPSILNRIANCVFSHSAQLQRLGLSITGDSSLILPCVSFCRSLTSLKLSVYHKGIFCASEKTLFPKSLNLPAVTTLDLTNFAFCTSDITGSAEPFSAFNSLSSLILCSCVVQVAQILSISSATLINLTIDRRCSELPKIELNAPRLSTFTFIGTPDQKLCGSTVSSIKQVNIDAFTGLPNGESPLVLLSWLIDLPNVKSLKVTSSTLLVLCLVPDLLKLKFTSLCNLNSLKVEMRRLSFLDSGCLAVMLENKSSGECSEIKQSFNAGLEPCATILDRIVGFLIQNSPLAKVDIKGYRSAYKLVQNDISLNEDAAKMSQPSSPFSTMKNAH